VKILGFDKNNKENLLIFSFIYIEEVMSMKTQQHNSNGGGGVGRLEKRERCVDI
jgi:hypothetical protein